MSTKSIIAGAALICLLMTSVAPTRARTTQEETTPAALTEKEEREARAIAREFEERLRADSDFAPLIRDLFVPDFAARLKAEGASFYPFLMLDEQLARKLDAEESLRCYTVHMNFLALWMRFQMSERVTRHLIGEEEPDDESFDKMFPPSVLEVLKSNPTFGSAFGSEKRDEEQARGEAEAKDADEEYSVKSREELSDLLSTLERANIKFREHMRYAPRMSWSEAQKTLARNREGSEEQEADSDNEDDYPQVSTIGRESFLGVPKDSRVICIDVVSFHMDLVDVDGHLKVLGVYLPNN